MRYISLNQAQEGMRLAYDVYDSSGRTLAGHNLVLTENYINRLQEYGVSGVCIDDELSEGIEGESAISPMLRIRGIDCIKTSNIDGCKAVAKQIVEELLAKKDISLDMMDLRSYDDYTYAHSVNVAVLCCVIGTGMNMNALQLENLVMAAILHDLGKLSIPMEILNKPDRLTQEEYQIMKSHSTRSYELIKDRQDLSAFVKVAVLEHHENVDGSGYPKGLEGSEQSLYTKILHVADVYDALISRRPYKDPYSVHEAVEYLMGGCGILFDRDVVTALLNCVSFYPRGSEPILSDGRKGIIYENGGVHNLRPIIRLEDKSLLDLARASNINLTIRDIHEMVSPEESECERQKMLEPILRYRIMAVDDMKSNLQLLQSLLEEDYDLILLRSGMQALSYMENNPIPDLILMDIDMPRMNGLVAAKKIQEISNRRIPILFVTALCDKETVLQCRELNAAGYIVRPYNPSYVRTEIKRILERWSDV